MIIIGHLIGGLNNQSKCIHTIDEFNHKMNETSTERLHPHFDLSS